MVKDITKLKHRFPIISKIISLLINNWLLFLLVVFSLILSFLNYQPNTSLTGWDNLQPELNFRVNLQRSIFAVWQEYQSLGLLGGMAHGADLPRIIFFYALSVFHFPLSIYRYLWTFLMLAIGPLGVYVFLKNFFLKHKFDQKTIHFSSFLGGLFYLLNLSTVQHFFTPFETFSSFYGFFPWLIVGLLYFMTKPSARRFLFLGLINFLAAPSFYTETLFVVYGFCLVIILADYVYASHHRLNTLAESIFSLTAIGLVNAYWLLPVVFFVVTNGSVGLAAKINTIATTETYYRNLAFGNLANLAILRGFWFDFLDLAGGNKFDYLLLPWRSHLSNPLILILGFLFFGLILTGAIYSFLKKLPLRRSVLGISFLCFFFLMGGGLLINQSAPLIGELFRSPFTKFSTALAFGYSIFFAVGGIFILDLFSFLHSRLTYYLTLFSVTLALVIFMTPAFTGNLISPTMRLKIPDEYNQLFEFFKNQDPATRIANFPQSTFWGWNYYSWGYRGSGFLWYGIKQPILDRAFDVWSRPSEKYYEEISTALYSENQDSFENLVDKYAINWILLDRNVTSPDVKQDLGSEKLQKILDNSDKFVLEKNINDKILIYKTNVDKTIKNFLSLSVSPSLRGVSDEAIYTDTGSPRDDETSPFTNLTLRPFISGVTNSSIELKIENSKIENLRIPSYTETEDLIPTIVSYRKTPDGLQLKFAPNLPQIIVDNKNVDLGAIPTYLDFSLPENESGLVVGINGQYLEIALPDELSNQSVFYPLTNLYLPSRLAIKVTLYSNIASFKLDLTNPLSLAVPAQCYTDKPNRKIEKIIEGKTISLLGTDLVGCLSTPIPTGGLNQLISLEFTYQSDTDTPANANVTDRSLGGESSPQPLTTQKNSTFTRVFAKSSVQPQQVNLILEANESKSTQEIVYKDVVVKYLPLLGESTFFTNPVSPVQIPNPQQVRNLSVSIPIAAEKSSLNPQARNCDNFNQGQFDRQTNANGTLYSATKANSCDQVNLRHLSHQTNYVVMAEVKNQKGLLPTICLENHATRRCDVFERLINGPQLILQPINNPNELPGYTLHLFNQSFGNRETKNLIKSLAIAPFPLNFLKDITLSTGSEPAGTTGSEPVRDHVSSSHPVEFLYALKIENSKIVEQSEIPLSGKNSILSLYQARSPYWKALSVSEKDLKLPTWLLIAKLPLLYLKQYVIPAKAGIYSNRSPIKSEMTDIWYNSWELPPGPYHLVIFYLPQYLEFIGFFLLPIPFLVGLIYLLIAHKKKKSPR